MGSDAQALMAVEGWALAVARARAAFENGDAAGLLHLGAVEVAAELPPTLASRLASIFGIEVLPEKPEKKPASATAKRRAASPPKRPTSSRPSPPKRRRRTRS